MKPIPILLYHSIADQVAPPFKKWAVAPAAFASHLDYLKSHHYRPMTVSQLVDSTENNSASLPERPVVITFDDGFADFYTGAFPALRQYDFTATLYITTGYIGQTSRWLSREGEGERPMLTWDQIRELHANGIECGAHTHHHPQLDTLTMTAAHDEIVTSKLMLEHYLRQPVTTFAYPHGYYSPAVRRIVQETGFSSACAVKHAMSYKGDDRFALARIIVAADTNTDAFARLLAGQDLPVALKRERIQTKGWRWIRRSAKLINQRRLTP